MNQGITAPTHTPLRLDTSTHIFATDKDGKLILSDTTGQPIQIAQDLTSALWYGKVADSFPYQNNDQARAKLQTMLDAGGVHVAHDDERYRGVWVPLEGQYEPAAFEDASTKGKGKTTPPSE